MPTTRPLRPKRRPTASGTKRSDPPRAQSPQTRQRPCLTCVRAADCLQAEQGPSRQARGGLLRRPSGAPARPVAARSLPSAGAAGAVSVRLSRRELLCGGARGAVKKRAQLQGADRDADAGRGRGRGRGRAGRAGHQAGEEEQAGGFRWGGGADEAAADPRQAGGGQLRRTAAAGGGAAPGGGETRGEQTGGGRTFRLNGSPPPPLVLSGHTASLTPY